MINVGLDLLLIPRFGIIGAMIPVGLAIAVSPLALPVRARQVRFGHSNPVPVHREVLSRVESRSRHAAVRGSDPGRAGAVPGRGGGVRSRGVHGEKE